MGMRISGRLAGNAGALAAALIFGSTPVVTRVLVQDVPPLSLAFLRSGQGALILCLTLLAGPAALRGVARRDLPYLALLGALLFAAFPGTYNVGFRLTEASRGALVLATIPAWSALLARMAGRERLLPRQASGVALAFGGVALVLGERGLNWEAAPLALLGDAILVVTALCQATYTVLAKRMLARYRSLTVVTYAMALGSLLLLPAALAEDGLQALGRLDGQGVLLLLYLGVFGGAIGYFCWTFALSRLLPTQVAVYVNLVPIVGATLGTTLLGEPLTGVFLLGLVAVLGGVLLVNWPRRAATATAR